VTGKSKDKRKKQKGDPKVRAVGKKSEHKEKKRRDDSESKIDDPANVNKKKILEIVERNIMTDGEVMYKVKRVGQKKLDWEEEEALTHVQEMLDAYNEENPTGKGSKDSYTEDADTEDSDPEDSKKTKISHSSRAKDRGEPKGSGSKSYKKPKGSGSTSYKKPKRPNLKKEFLRPERTLEVSSEIMGLWIERVPRIPRN